MMEVVCLSAADRQLLRARFSEHRNSHRRMHEALTARGATDDAARIAALRRIEQRFDLDLAEICHRHAHRRDVGTHPIERMVLEFIAEEKHVDQGVQLWIMPENVQQVRGLMDGRLVGEPES